MERCLCWALQGTAAEVEDEEGETDDFVVPEDEELPEEILTGAALAAAQAESKAAQERFAEELKARSKAAADMFDEMVVHEERIRLDEPGWKGRYYEVGARAQTIHFFLLVIWCDVM